jgi:hypothetical protein
LSNSSEQNRIYYLKNKKRLLKKIKDERLNFPWKYTLRTIKTRCNNLNFFQFKDYGGRGIKCLITEEELKELWFRDKAYLMKRPSIDRIDNDGNYCIENCRYIELKENISRNSRKVILQFNLDGIFIKEWKSITQAARYYNIYISAISNCATGRKYSKSAGGYIWRYK